MDLSAVFQPGITLVGGGLAGAILNHSIQRYRRPRVHLIFSAEERGCEVETGSVEQPTIITQRYLRIKILNSGWTSAENTSVSITRISFTSKTSGLPQDFGEEVLDLKLSLIGERVFRVAPGAHRFLDLCSTRKNSSGVAYGFEFAHSPVRLTTFGWGSGTYSAELFASADEAHPVRAVVKWSWDGSFKGLRAGELGHMF